MHRSINRFVLPGLILGVLATFSFCAFCFWPRPGIRANLSVSANAQAVPYSYLCLQFVKPIELGDTKLQFRVAGRWLAPERLDLLPAPLSTEMRTLLSQKGAEACRFHLTYRGPSARDKMLLYLVRHGWWQKAPRLCSWMAQGLPAHRNWEHTVLEYELPRKQDWAPRTPGLVGITRRL